MLVKINIKHVELGMFIHELCGSWLEHPFWRSQFLLESPKDLKRLRDSGVTELWIDVRQGKAPLTASTPVEEDRHIDQVLAHTQEAPKEPALRHPTPESRRSLADELDAARSICLAAESQVKELFMQARLGRAIPQDKPIEVVQKITQSIQRNPHAIISLARIKTKDNYTYLHSVAVSALMIALAQKMGLSKEQTQTAGLGGLMHDVGKVHIPLSILMKPSSLSDEEFEIIRGHPEAGHHILQREQGFPSDVLDIALHHHEKVDGSGYPHKLKGAAISRYAKMAAVCDIYDAITSDRPYKQGWRPGIAVRKMAEWSQGHFDQKIFHTFVKTVGIYPIGSLVKLKGGNLAVVVDQHETNLLAPKVKPVYCTLRGQRIEHGAVHLHELQDDIVAQEDPLKWGLDDLDEMWRD
jgi:putative nucleotidyltransferase with HDIG domain